MLKAISALYQTPDLTGAALTRPLQKYHWFFQGKINNPNSDGLTRGAWLAANIFSGIVIYPTFGIVAGVGMVVKLCGIPALNAHNNRQIAKIEEARAVYARGEVYHERGDNVLKAPKGYVPVQRMELKVPLEDYDSLLNILHNNICALSYEYRKAAMEIVPVVRSHSSEIAWNKFYIYTLEPVIFTPADESV